MANFFIFLSLLVCQLTLTEAVSVEPLCSKFSYDEQLLEKMVRMEFFVENVQKDAEKSVSNVMDMIHDIKGNNSELSNRLSEQQENVDLLERQVDILNDTMANKIIVSENTESIRSITADVRNIRNDLKNNTSGLDNLMGIADAINKKCEDGLSNLSKDLERQTNVLIGTMANKSIVSENTKSMRNMTVVVGNIIKDLEKSTSGLDNLMRITDAINKKCEDGLSDLSKDLERLTNVLSDTMANRSIVSENTKSMSNMTVVVGNIIKDLEKSTSGLDYLKVVTDEINKKCKDGLSDLSKNLERQTSVLSDTMANKSIVSENTKSIKSMALNVENIKKDLEKSTSGLDDLKTVTGEVKATCKDGLLDLSNKFAALEKQIKELDQATEKKTQTVAFNVMDAISFTDREPVKFSNVIFNEGDAYNKDTGMFTAPTDGIYQFNAHICGKTDANSIEYYIKVGSKAIVSGEFVLPARASDTKCTSFSAVALVRKGESVLVGGMKFSELDRIDNDLSSFSGVLIRAV